MLKTIHIVYILVGLLVVGLGVGLALYFWPKGTTAAPSSQGGSGSGGGGGGAPSTGGYTSQFMTVTTRACFPSNLGAFPVSGGSRVAQIVSSNASLNISGNAVYSDSPISPSLVSQVADAFYQDAQESGVDVSRLVVIYQSDEFFDGVGYQISPFWTSGAPSPVLDTQIGIIAGFWPTGQATC